MRHLGIGFLASCAITLLGCTNIETVTIQTPDLARIPDGTYVGTELVFPVRAKVSIDVESGRIVGFRILKHFSSSHGKPAESLATRVVEEQTLLVDAVSGATFSSKVILKAAENALESALRNPRVEAPATGEQPLS